MAGTSRKARRNDPERRRAENRAGLIAPRRTHSARPRLKAYGLAVAAAAMAGAGLFLWSRFDAALDHRHAVVASGPQPISASAPTRSLANLSQASAEGAAKAQKSRRDAAALQQDDPAIDHWFMAAYLRCWSPPANIPADRGYAAKIRVQHNVDGTLAGAPLLVNPPSDPEWRAYAESAIQAVKKCNPLSIPAEYLPRFDHWRKATLYFSPDSAQD